MCAGLCPTYWTTFGNAEKNRNGSCFTHEWDRPQLFWVFNSPPPPRGRWIPEGEGHVGRHCPYTNKIWCGSVHALLRYRLKTAKMQKFPIERKFHFLLFPPTRGCQPPKKEKTHPEPEYARMQNFAWISPRVVEKSLTKKRTDKKTYTNQIPFALRSNKRIAGNKKLSCRRETALRFVSLNI